MTRNAKLPHIPYQIRVNLDRLSAGDKEAVEILQTAMPFVNSVFLAQSTQPFLAPGEIFHKEFPFWPKGVTQEEVSNFMNPRTVVMGSGESLEETPYSVKYEEGLAKICELLRQAAKKVSSDSFRTFLISRASSFESNDYEQSEINWLKVESAIEIIIGFYESYADTRFGVKTTMEAVLGVITPEKNERLQLFQSYANAFDAWLGNSFQFESSPILCPMVALDVVESAGGSLYEIVPMACCLPNEENIRREFGSKKCFFVNSMEAKFEVITTEIARRVLPPHSQELFTFRGFFEATIGHEISHGLSFHFDSDFREACHGLEELKADVFGLQFIYWLEEKGVLPQGSGNAAVVTNLVDKLRQIRFGIESAHAQGALVQMQFAERSKLISFVAGRLEIKEAHLREYVEKICFHTYQAFRGGYSRGVFLIKEFGVVTEGLQSLVSSLSDVPVDIDPHYT